MLNSSPPAIRKAIIKDVSWIVTLAYDQMNQYLEDAYEGPFDWENWERDIRGIIFNDKEEYGTVNVFYDNKTDENMGFWWVTPYNDHIWIDAFVIKPQYQRKGIGSSLINIVKDHFNMYFPKNQSIELGVQERNIEAVNFYQNHGFKVIDDPYMNTYYTLRMVKKL